MRVPDPAGKEFVTVSPGIQPGKVLRATAKGCRASAVGDAAI